jgi:hypothetical protein
VDGDRGQDHHHRAVDAVVAMRIHRCCHPGDQPDAVPGVGDAVMESDLCPQWNPSHRRGDGRRRDDGDGPRPRLHPAVTDQTGRGHGSDHHGIGVDKRSDGESAGSIVADADHLGFVWVRDKVIGEEADPVGVRRDSQPATPRAVIGDKHVHVGANLPGVLLQAIPRHDAIWDQGPDQALHGEPHHCTTIEGAPALGARSHHPQPSGIWRINRQSIHPGTRAKIPARHRHRASDGSESARAQRHTTSPPSTAAAARRRLQSPAAATAASRRTRYGAVGDVLADRRAG